MKATVDIPDELYRRVKAKSAIEGRQIREVTAELYRRWLADQPDSGDPAASRQDQAAPGDATGAYRRWLETAGPGPLDAERWVEEWVRLGAAILGDAPEGSHVVDDVAAGRARLDRD